MNHFLLLAFFFGCVMAGAVAAGYFFVLRPDDEAHPDLFTAEGEGNATQAFAAMLPSGWLSPGLGNRTKHCENG